MAQLQCLIFALDPAIGEQIRDQVDSADHVSVCGEVTDETSLQKFLKRDRADLLIVGLGEDGE